MEKSIDTIGNRTRDLPACSAVPQPTAPPRDSTYYIILYYNIMVPPSHMRSLVYRNVVMRRMTVHYRPRVPPPRSQQSHWHCGYVIVPGQVHFIRTRGRHACLHRVCLCVCVCVCVCKRHVTPAWQQHSVMSSWRHRKKLLHARSCLDINTFRQTATSFDCD